MTPFFPGTEPRAPAGERRPPGRRPRPAGGCYPAGGRAGQEAGGRTGQEAGDRTGQEAGGRTGQEGGGRTGQEGARRGAGGRLPGRRTVPGGGPSPAEGLTRQEGTCRELRPSAGSRELGHCPLYPIEPDYVLYVNCVLTEDCCPAEENRPKMARFLPSSMDLPREVGRIDFTGCDAETSQGF
jgi:hypothetical protein